MGQDEITRDEATARANHVGDQEMIRLTQAAKDMRSAQQRSADGDRACLQRCLELHDMRADIDVTLYGTRNHADAMRFDTDASLRVCDGLRPFSKAAS